MKQKKTRLSIIVCTFNRCKILPQCLELLVNQTAEQSLYEVIIVDNNSTDATYELAKKYTVKHDNWSLYFEPQQGLSFARNLGLEKATSDYVAYIDDEACARENWVEVALNIIKNYSPDIFGGSAQPVFPDGKPTWYKDEYGVRGDMGETGWIDNGFIIGTNFFIKKSLLENYGGFDTDAGMKGSEISYHEETIIVNRALKEGKRVFFSKELDVFDLIPDYKKSIIFFIYAKYKAGRDGEKIWKPSYTSNDLFALLKLIDDTFNEFNVALMSRDKTLFRYPENYIIEKVRDNFFKIGLQIQLILKYHSKQDHFIKLNEKYDLLQKKYNQIKSEMDTVKKNNETKEIEIKFLQGELNRIKNS